MIECDLTNNIKLYLLTLVRRNILKLIRKYNLCVCVCKLILLCVFAAIRNLHNKITSIAHTNNVRTRTCM